MVIYAVLLTTEEVGGGQGRAGQGEQKKNQDRLAQIITRPPPPKGPSLTNDGPSP